MGHQSWFWGKRGRSTVGLGYWICVRCGRVKMHNAASQAQWKEPCPWTTSG